MHGTELKEDKIPEILKAVESKLEQAAQRGIKLHVTETQLEDGWLYVVVAPDAGGVRASDHAETMTEIEVELDDAGYPNVLLVPTLMSI